MPRCNRRRPRGFTLLELLVTVAVAAIILSVGVPGFFSFIQNNRAATHANDVVTALNLARSEALRRGTPVRVCSSSDGAVCSGSVDWSNGWIAVAADGTPNGTVLRVWGARAGGANTVTGPAQVEFQARGTAAAATVVQVRLPRCTGNQGRDVDVSLVGRIAVTREDCA